MRPDGTNAFQFRNDFSGGPAEFETHYGTADDEVLIGTFRAGGHDTLNVVRGNSFHLKFGFSGGAADLRTDYGSVDDYRYVIGDWDGDGVDTPAIHRVNDFHLKNDFTGGPADRVVRVGEDEGPAFGVRLPGRTSDSIVTLFVPGLGA